MSARATADDARHAERAAQFEREIRPVLISQCLKCQGESKQECGIRLDTRAGVLQGGESGPALVAGNPDESLLIDALHHRSLEMPPTSKLPYKTILHFERWVEGGAVWPETAKKIREAEGDIKETDRE